MTTSKRQRLSLKGYYQAYKSVLGLFATLLALFPLANLFPLGNEIFLPPLGSSTALASAISAAFALLSSFAVYALRPVRTARGVIGCAIVSFACAVAYFAATDLYVREVAIPSENASVRVSIGATRTTFADTFFPGQTDEQILRGRGLDDEQINRIWTRGSVLRARLILWLTFSLCILFGTASLGFGILGDTNSNPAIGPPGPTPKYEASHRGATLPPSLRKIISSPSAQNPSGPAKSEQPE